MERHARATRARRPHSNSKKQRREPKPSPSVSMKPTMKPPLHGNQDRENIAPATAAVADKGADAPDEPAGSGPAAPSCEETVEPAPAKFGSSLPNGTIGRRGLGGSSPRSDCASLIEVLAATPSPPPHAATGPSSPRGCRLARRSTRRTQRWIRSTDVSVTRRDHPLPLAP